MQQLDAQNASPSTTSSNAKRVRTFDAKVAKILKDNFPGWPSAQVDVLQRDGKTLKERISQDK
eukprot:1861025-Prorocentrum_lima.AAC.1